MTDGRRLDGRVAVVTGAGRGVGRAHARELAGLGASVVVNDTDVESASAVVAEIEAAGGHALAEATPVGGWDEAETIVRAAVDAYGQLDVLINNAGVLRPRTLVSMTRQEWDDVLRVHLDGTLTLTQAVGRHWRARYKSGETLHARLINTTSSFGLYGAGQANYAAAKAGIVAVTLVAARELAAYGATVNAVSPVALTRMSAGMASEAHTPEHVARLAAWLCGDAAADVTGEVFAVAGGHVSVVERPHAGPGTDKPGHWTLDELDNVVPRLLMAAPAHPDLLGYRPDEQRPDSLSEVLSAGLAPSTRTHR